MVRASRSCAGGMVCCVSTEGLAEGLSDPMAIVSELTSVGGGGGGGRVEELSASKEDVCLPVVTSVGLT